MLQPIGIFAIAAVFRAARRLHIGRAPGLWAERPQNRGGMKRAGADLHVIGLQDRAALRRPKGLQAQDEALERSRRIEPRRLKILCQSA